MRCSFFSLWHLLVVEDPMVMVQVFPILFRLFPGIKTLRKNIGEEKYTLNRGGVPCRRGR